MVNLVGVCDTSRATAVFAQKRFGAKSSFSDASEMLAATQPDVVHVLTPPQSHMLLVSMCLNSGAHVICEKPMTSSASETADLLLLAKEKGKILIESRNLLFNDIVLKADKLIASGTIGEVREIDLLLALDLNAGPFGDLNLQGPGVDLPGGAVHDFLPHLAYLFLHFAECSGPASNVCGSLQNRSGNARVGFDHLDALVTAGHCRGRMRIASDLKPDMFRLILRGTKATIESDFYGPFMRVQLSGDSGKMAPFEQIRSGVNLARSGFGNLRDKVMQHGTYHGFPRMLAAIYDSLRAGTAPPIMPAEIASTAALVDQLINLRHTR
jgi:predicted dehydrogenase